MSLGGFVLPSGRKARASAARAATFASALAIIAALAACGGVCDGATNVDGKCVEGVVGDDTATGIPDAGTEPESASAAGKRGSAGAGGKGGAGGTGAGRAAGRGGDGRGADGDAAKMSIDPAVQWMCTKDRAGHCTSCDADADCPTSVCELGYCMDCRDASDCDEAESCISHRCVPERKPSSVWTTAGGGQTTVSGFKLQLTLGTPAPAGRARAEGYALSVSAGAGFY